MVARLCRFGPLSTAGLTAGTSVSRQAVTKHLKALQGAGLVRSERAGRDRVWELKPQWLAELRAYVEAISAQWNGTLIRLRDLVEAP